MINNRKLKPRKILAHLKTLPYTHVIEITAPHFVQEEIVIQQPPNGGIGIALNGRFTGQSEMTIRKKCDEQGWTIVQDMEEEWF